MNRLIVLTSLLVMCFSAKSQTGQPRTSTSIEAMHTSNESDAFYFNVDKTMIGGEVEVFDSTGNKVMTQVIARNQTLVDLYHQNPGMYSIVIHKGEFSQKFDYNKETPSPYFQLSFFKTSKKLWRYC